MQNMSGKHCTMLTVSLVHYATTVSPMDYFPGEYYPGGIFPSEHFPWSTVSTVEYFPGGHFPWLTQIDTLYGGLF